MCQKNTIRRTDVGCIGSEISPDQEQRKKDTGGRGLCRPRSKAGQIDKKKRARIKGQQQKLNVSIAGI
jgi:hypothetical protein